MDNRDGVTVAVSLVTGSLISPTVVLTVGHVLTGKASARVSFLPDVSTVDWRTGGYLGTPHVYPGYIDAFRYADIGVVVLDRPVPTSEVPRYAQLPSVGLAATLGHMAGLEYVGYGRYDQIQAPGVRPFDRWVRDGLRRYATGQLMRCGIVGQFRALFGEVPPPPDWGSMFLETTTNPGDDRGGVAVGDSGGPALMEGTDVVLGMVSFGSGGDPNLVGPQHFIRVDMQPFLDWITGFVSP